MSATVAEPRAALHPISVWPQYPSTYEINTWVWLSDLSQTYGIAVDLFSVPFAEWDAKQIGPAARVSANLSAGISFHSTLSCPG